jgi:hypothetical protein
VAEQDRDVLDRHAVLQQRDGERIAEAVGVAAVDPGQLEDATE